jgi:hypothetical protein
MALVRSYLPQAIVIGTSTIGSPLVTFFGGALDA